MPTDRPEATRELGRNRPEEAIRGVRAELAREPGGAWLAAAMELLDRPGPART